MSSPPPTTRRHLRPDSQLSLSALLGLSDGGGLDWSRLRALQHQHSARHWRTGFLGHLFACIAAVWISHHALPWWASVGWILTLALGLTRYIVANRIPVDRIERISRQRAFLRALGSAPIGLAWGGFILSLAIWGDRGQLLTAAPLLIAVMATSAALMAVVPLAALLFLALSGGGAVAALILGGALIPAGAVAVLTLTLATNVVLRGENFLRVRDAEADRAEKDEVVSLLLREFEESEADWLWQIDTARRVRDPSVRFAYALGRDPDAIEGEPFLRLILGADWDESEFLPSHRQLADRLNRRESFSSLAIRVAIGGEARWWELSGMPMYDERGHFAGFRGVGSDVTEQHESNRKIAYLARYDTLSGLPNRMMLTEALAEALRYAEKWDTQCALLMLDLDRFKAVNDSLGHLVGDALLAQVARRLRDAMDDNAFCGRLGGDEFAVVVRDASDRQALDRFAERLIAILSEPYTVDQHTLHIGASVGSATGPADGTTVEKMLRNADLALYRAKDRAGGTHSRYEPNLFAVAEERRQLESALRGALERDEFRLKYQPIVDAESETLSGFEALVRWQREDGEIIGPDRFIRLAEETRLILPIGRWVMESACRDAADWPPHVRLSVNVSAEQLLDADFVGDVVRALTTSGLTPERLEIEVTESVFLNDADGARRAMEAIIALGCKVALDDFGTGYSSLGYLRKLHFSNIKIDRSFVTGAAEGNIESLAIIRAVVAMAQFLDMATTAEGVEQPAEANLVRELGCSKMQGYLFGRPMDAREALGLFRRMTRESA